MSRSCLRRVVRACRSACRQCLPRVLGLLLLAAGLAGCAGGIAPPTVVMPLTGEQRATLHLSTVRTDAAPGVAITEADTARVTQLVIQGIQDVAPGLIGGAGAGTKSLRIVITRYDSGSSGARFLLAGLGQIRLDGDVLVTDTATGQKVAEYRVEKQFAFGGIYGAVTSIQDVEKGFARSVAALFKPGS